MKSDGAEDPVPRMEVPANAGLRWEDVPELICDLREMAQRLLNRWPGMASLQPTLLVCTALRRARRSDQSWDEVTWETRGQFFGQLFRAMRQKLIEYRRHQHSRGYETQRRISVVDLELLDASRSWAQDPDQILALDAALEHIEDSAPDVAKLIHYRFFGGLSWREVEDILDITEGQRKHRWKRARLLIEEAIEETLREPRHAGTQN